MLTENVTRLIGIYREGIERTMTKRNIIKVLLVIFGVVVLSAAFYIIFRSILYFFILSERG